MEQNNKYWRTEAAVEIQEDGSAIVYNKKTGMTHVLNTTGAYIYKNCEEKTIAEIAAEFANNARDTSFDEILEDVENMISELLSVGLIVKNV